MFKNILFDLDGTIIDSREGIINGFVYTLKHFCIEVQDRTSLEKFIGPPLEDTKRKKCSSSHIKTRTLCE